MKLSELIRLKDAMDGIHGDNMRDEAKRNNIILASIRKTFGEHDERIENYKDEIQNTIEQVNDSVNQMLNTRSKFMAYLDTEIKIQTELQITHDNKYYEQMPVKFKTADYVRKFQQMKIEDDTKKVVLSRIGNYMDWRFPGLEIGPGDGEWTRELVASDPLYIVDYNDEFLSSTKANFNEQYQRRLRAYKNMGKGLLMLPQEQFGFVFSWNTFNYMSLESIQQYLADIYHVLRDGGACIFSYNNGERYECARRSEENIMSFIPKTILVDIIKGYGYIDIRTYDYESTVSWVEFRKPGELTSQRGGQTLGKIIRKEHVQS